MGSAGGPNKRIGERIFCLEARATSTNIGSKWKEERVANITLDNESPIQGERGGHTKMRKRMYDDPSTEKSQGLKEWTHQYDCTKLAYHQ
jgi:hypothetical protein